MPDATSMNGASGAPVSVELLQRYDRPGPRYTSYPTAVEFDESFSQADYRRQLIAANRAATEALSLYVHLPFCARRCSFCGCNVIITQKRAVVDRYLDYLHGELDLLAAHLPDRRRVTQYHWGGGTPTYLDVEQMRALHAKVTQHFDLDPDGEIAIECDPRVTTREQLELLRELGFNRISFGVQDLDPQVQAAIDREQDVETTRALLEHARAIGFSSINVDLIYGLPLQATAPFRKTVDQIVEMHPDRIALYSYAYVPWIQGNQKKIDPEQLPLPKAKLGLFCLARNMLLDAGYEAIGMDHFALPEDEMAVASREHRLHRNFMGYTVKSGTDMIGVGVSAIGDVRGAFAQNTKKLSRYYAALDTGRFPIERGYVLDRDDEIRRAVIAEIMCNFRLDLDMIERRFDIQFARYFEQELRELVAADGPVEHGFLRVEPRHLEVVGHGRLFVRNLAMVFDAHLRQRKAERQVFSRTV